VGRLLVDASCLIALGRIGRLPLFSKFPQPVCTTSVVVEEATNPAYPETEIVRKAISEGWIDVIETSQPAEQSTGVGRGEQTLLDACREDDFLGLDDGAARRVAEVHGYSLMGTLGLLVAANQNEIVSTRKTLGALDRLAESDFRMTVDLYRRARSLVIGHDDG
jgi:predicted nucleic acid-binding protein